MEQKVAVVTGGAGAGAGGSGRYITEKLVGEGYRVAIWDIACAAGQSLAARLGEASAYMHCDICDEKQVADAVRKTVEAFGGIDLLVNNAFWHADEQPPLHSISLEDWDRHININLRCHFIVCKYAIPQLLERESSVIVNIGSTGAHRGEDGYGAYSAAKAGLESLTRSIAAQYGRSGLRCNCLVPGLVLDRHMDALLEQVPAVKEAFDRIDRTMLLNHGHGDGSCVADAVWFLASDASRYLTGQSIVLDGGTISHFPQWADLREQESDRT